MIGPNDLPAVNAVLNTATIVLLTVGYKAIRARRVALHKTCMLSALAVSSIFLASYLYYHIAVKGGQPTHFSRQAPDAPAWVGKVYLAILTTHTLLAAIVAPLALFTAWQGLRGNLQRHMRI